LFDLKAKPQEGYLKELTTDFIALFPAFSASYDRLVYIGSEKPFLSHTGAY
jgi:hypothetical protein